MRAKRWTRRRAGLELLALDGGSRREAAVLFWGCACKLGFRPPPERRAYVRVQGRAGNELAYKANVIPAKAGIQVCQHIAQ